MASSVYSSVPATLPVEEDVEDTVSQRIFESRATHREVRVGTGEREGSCRMPLRCAGIVMAAAGLGLVALLAISMLNADFKASTHTFARVPSLQEDAIQQDTNSAATTINTTTSTPRSKSIQAANAINTMSESASIIPLLIKVLREMAGGMNGAADMSEDTYEDAKKWFKKLNQSVRDFKKVGKRVVQKLNRSAHEFQRVGKEVAKQMWNPIRLSMSLKTQLQSLTSARKAMLRDEILRGLNLTSLADLRPADTGGCYEDEEFHEGLCYKRCAILTEGREPVRISAFQCCAHQAPCTGKLDIEPTLCGGYAVGGKASGNGCAREPARCLQSEEFEGGLCYLRCNLLSYGILPYRSTSDTCCKSNSPLAMLEPGACDTDERFDVAGGRHDPSASNVPHPPLY